jgi:hypothetical protein
MNSCCAFNKFIRSIATVLTVMVLLFTGCVIDNEDPPVDLTPPQLLRPLAGQLLDNGCVNNRTTIQWNFSWTPKERATRYHLRLKAQNALVAAVDNENLTGTSYQHVINGYIGSSNLKNWTWQVRAYIRGNWTEWSTGTFDVKEPDLGC